MWKAVYHDLRDARGFFIDRAVRRNAPLPYCLTEHH